MIDYAKISKMLEYRRANIWPWSEFKGIGFGRRFKDIAKILLSWGPVLTPYGGKDNIDAFMFGTRGWEYPWVLEQIKGVKLGAKVLDCGCGVSGFLEELYQRNLLPTGLDFFVENSPKRRGYGITNSHRKGLEGKVEFVNGGMHDIPIDSNEFDVVTCISVMEHVVEETCEDPAYHLRCLDEMKRVLKPGGLLVCTYDTWLIKGITKFPTSSAWGEDGWYYLNDISYLNMKLKNPGSALVSREEIMLDHDAYFVPPLYFFNYYGSEPYRRVTSVGFAVIK
jgi:SAM-dependent methyltransferase